MLSVDQNFNKRQEITKTHFSKRTCMCMYMRLCMMRCTVGVHCWKFSHWPSTLVSQKPVCVSKRALLLCSYLLTGGGKESFRGSSGFSQKRTLLRAWKLIGPLLLHPSRLLTFTPDPVTPSSGLQQQQKEEIREIDRLERITVALFIWGCAQSWHSLLAVLNLSAVYLLVCVLMLAVVCT